jgi:hypothetical protein
MSSLDSINRLRAVERFELIKSGDLNVAGPSKEVVEETNVEEAHVSLNSNWRRPRREKWRRMKSLLRSHRSR